MRSALITLFLTILVTIPCIANSTEDSESKVGLMASFQGTHSDITIPFRAGPNILFGPSFSLIYVEGIGSDLGIGLLLKSYQSDIEEHKVIRFWSMRSGVFKSIPKEGKGTSDLMVGLGLGADYYFHEKMALGAEAQLNLVKSDKNSSRFGNPGGVNMNTAGSIALTIFF